MVEGEDDSSFVSTSSAESPSSSTTKDPSNDPTIAPLDHADAATAQAKATCADDALVDEEEWNKQAAQGYFPGGFDALEQSPQRRAFTLLHQVMLNAISIKASCVICT